MSGINLKDPAAFGKAFLEGCSKGGLGSLSKRDVDVLVFHLLLADGRYELPRDIFKACRELKLSEAKVRTLYQEVQLKYMQYDEEEAKKKFIALVESGSIERKGDKLTFIVREPLLRQYFEEWVASKEGFLDSSFNKNLVTIHISTFSDVLEQLAKIDFKKIKGNFHGELAPLNKATTLKKLMGQFAEEFAKSAGKESGAMTVKALATGLKLLILGGVD